LKAIKQYKSLGGATPVECFINGLTKKQCDKVYCLLFLISADANALKPPYVKAFRIEKYKGLYELRARMVKMIRIIFYLDEEGDIVLLHAFMKKHERSTEKALDISKARVLELIQFKATISKLGGIANE